MTDQTKPITALGLLKAAREKISKPENWTKRSFARDANGESIATNSPEAVCFCAAGALFNAAEVTTFSVHIFGAKLELSRAGDELQKFLSEPYVGVEDFNDADSTEHADVLRLFDLAIASLEASK